MQAKLMITLISALLLSNMIAIAPAQSGRILATSNTEVYAYKYIVELYDAGDSANLNKEIKQFYARFPDSAYTPYVHYIEANLALEAGENTLAQQLYASLLKENLSQEVLGELMLNYALSLAQTKDYAAAMHLLQRVDSEIANPSLSELANLQKADIYYQMGQYYSAEKAYLTALKAFPDDAGLCFSLFSTYVKLNHETQALEILHKQQPDSDLIVSYYQLWLEYLLANERYKDFDEYVTQTSFGKYEKSPTILDIRIRRALRNNDFETVTTQLQLVKPLNRQFSYYSALLQMNKGNEAAADSIFMILVNDPSPEIAIPAYLERLKILYKKEPLAAIAQLINYLKDNNNDLMKAELYYTLGYFCYHKEDFPEAIKQLGMAKHYEMNRELSARVDILTAEAWYAAGRRDLATDAFNRYLNLYPEGQARDRAWFYLGYISFLNKDYTRSKPCFLDLIQFHQQSPYLHDAQYYLAEMDFYLANYNLALQNYLILREKNKDNNAVNLRIAQIYYYLGQYSEVEKHLIDLQPSYEVSTLKGSMHLATKNYSAALDQFYLAESFATERLRKAEAQSYRALCLYQLKRFKEASALYLQLSTAKESPDTYLFLSAKSAYAARDYHQALELYNSFIEQHPESIHFMAALGEIANAYYNMGNYEKAVDDWINILTRYRNTNEFDDASLAIVRDALLGLELGLKRIESFDILYEILSLPDTFASEYIKFELNYILVKIYADKGLWADLILAAEKIQAQFPARKTDDIELLAATGLIQLNQYAEASSKLAALYNEKGSKEALLQWAGLEMLTQNYASAQEKFSLAFSSNPNAEIWLNMLDCSAANNYNGFEEIWQKGTDYLALNPQVYTMRMKQLFHDGLYDQTVGMADYILNNSLSTFDHATAFLYTGMVDFENVAYPSAIATLKRVIVLFPDFKDIRNQAVYYIVKSYALADMTTEAEMHLIQYANDLNPEQGLELNELMEGSK